MRTEGRTFRVVGGSRYLDEGPYRAGSFYRTFGVAHDPIGTVSWITLPPG